MKVMIEKEAHRKAAQKAVNEWERSTPGAVVGGTEIEVGDFQCIEGGDELGGAQLLACVHRETYGEAY